MATYNKIVLNYQQKPQDINKKMMKILCANSNKQLCEQICNKLGVKPLKVSISKFSDGETSVEIQENVRGDDVFVIQSTSYPANENIMELLVCLDALRRASTKTINVVIPYFGYARQDRKTAPRAPITAKLVANLIEQAGASRVLTMDLHTGQLQGFFDIPVDNLYARVIFADHIKNNFSDTSNIVIASPDAGGIARARSIAKIFGSSLAIIDKRREEAGKSEVMNVIGSVEDQDVIVIDDIIDSGGTLCNCANAFLNNGANSVCAYITHGVLSGKAFENISSSNLDKIYITDTIELTGKMRSCDKIEVISSAQMFAEAMKRILTKESISSLFDAN